MTPEATRQIEAMVAAEIACRRPQCQEDCCAIVARVVLSIGVWPQTDTAFIDSAVGMAAGLFGEAFAEADEAQRLAWIDMCEWALRDAARELTQCSMKSD